MSQLEERPAKSEKDITITLTAGEVRRIQRTGRTYQCMFIDLDGVIRIGLNQPADMGRFLYKGVGERLAPGEEAFTYIEFYNSDSVSRGLTLQTSYGDIRDSRFNLVTGGSPVNTIENLPTTIAPAAVAAVAATSNLDIAANALRRQLIIYNDDATAVLWWQDQSETTSIGVPIFPKEKFYTTFAGASRVRNPTAGSVNVYVTELNP